MIKDDALALMRNYIVAKRVAKPVQSDRKKIPAVVLPIKSQPVSLFLGGNRDECHGEGPVVSALVLVAEVDNLSS